MTVTPTEEIPIFTGLVCSDIVRKGGFNPADRGPAPIGRFPGLGITWADYEMDYTDPRWHRTRTMREVFADIPTGVWPTIGDAHGTTGEQQVAPVEGGEPLPAEG